MYHKNLLLCNFCGQTKRFCRHWIQVLFQRPQAHVTTKGAMEDQWYAASSSDWLKIIQILRCRRHLKFRRHYYSNNWCIECSSVRFILDISPLIWQGKNPPSQNIDFILSIQLQHRQVEVLQLLLDMSSTPTEIQLLFWDVEKTIRRRT